MCPAERNHGWWSVRELKHDVSLSDKGHRNRRPSARHGRDYSTPVTSNFASDYPAAVLIMY